jgi:hypothetical protein
MTSTRNPPIDILSTGRAVSTMAPGLLPRTVGQRIKIDGGTLIDKY